MEYFVIRCEVLVSDSTGKERWVPKSAVGPLDEIGDRLDLYRVNNKHRNIRIYKCLEHPFWPGPEVGELSADGSHAFDGANWSPISEEDS